MAGKRKSFLITNQKEYIKMMDEIRNIMFRDFKEFCDTRKFLSIQHFIYVCRFKPYITIMSERQTLFLPQGKMTPNKYAYITIPQIDHENNAEYYSRAIAYRAMKIIAELATKKPEGWIIDLRGNTGGIIEYFIISICQIVDEFELLGYDKYGNVGATVKSDGSTFKLEMDGETVISVEFPFKTNIKFKNIYVLIDKHTASAAELLAILLRKYKGAKICGERSYGIVSLMQSTTFNDCTFTYPVYKIMFDNGADHIEPDIQGIPEFLYPN